MSGCLHDVSQGGYGDEVDLYVVLFADLCRVHCGVDGDGGEEFEGCFGEDWTSGRLAGLVWVGYDGVRRCK